MKCDCFILSYLTKGSFFSPRMHQQGVYTLDRDFSNNDKKKYRHLLWFQQYAIPVATHPAIASHHLPSRSAQHGLSGRSSLPARRTTDFSKLDGQDTVCGTLWPLLFWLSLLLPGHWRRSGLPGRTGSGTPVQLAVYADRDDLCLFHDDPAF